MFHISKIQNFPSFPSEKIWYQPNRVMGSFFTLPSASKIHFFAHFLKPPTDAHTKTKQKKLYSTSFHKHKNIKHEIHNFPFFPFPPSSNISQQPKRRICTLKKKTPKTKTMELPSNLRTKKQHKRKKEMRSNKLGFSGRKEKRGETCQRRRAKRGRRRRPWWERDWKSEEAWISIGVMRCPSPIRLQRQRIADRDRNYRIKQQDSSPSFPFLQF